MSDFYANRFRRYTLIVLIAIPVLLVLNKCGALPERKWEAKGESGR